VGRFLAAARSNSLHELRKEEEEEWERCREEGSRRIKWAPLPRATSHGAESGSYEDFINTA
jgi:hypothetical protein